MPDTEPTALEQFLPLFRLSGFRPGQREVISAVLAGEDCLCVMPTGGGKSLCYQLPAVVRPGLTLVVSPLIALMKDQVDQLQSLGLAATFINSALPPAEQHARIDAMAAGNFRLVYIAPERFRSPRLLEAVRAARVRLLAVDEAHCISQWGHDFRPDYARLGRFRAMLAQPPTIALTATATDAVRRDIVQQLNLRNPRTFITGFVRPNLRYEVQTPHSRAGKDRALAAFLGENAGSGIVYASSRKRCEELAAQIGNTTGRPTAAYHAGMMSDARRAAQDRFMQGDCQVVVATTAFGMGIDKSDVRFVVHYNLPGSLEGYYQEAGRAGRDGQPARCLLLYSAGDRRIQEFFIESAYPARELVERVYDFLRRVDADPIELTQQEIKQHLALPISAEGVGACEQLLERSGVLERLESRENMALVRLDSELPTLVDLLPRQAKVQRHVLQAIERIVGPRRFEGVYLNPRQLMAVTELEASALNRTLRELNELKAFDYVPPFRGRAIRMLDRKRPFDELEIDFEALAKRKAAEYEKLNRVISFAQSPRCRQQDILDYFGQAGSPPCGRCDNCVQTTRPPARKPASPAEPLVAAAANEHLVEVVRKSLAGVARSRSRFGKHLVAQMLCGSGAAKVKKFRLDRLSTYGLLSDFKQEEIVQVLEALLAAGCLTQAGRDAQRPTLELTELGKEVMAGRAPVTFDLSLSPGLASRLGAPGRLASAVPSAARPDEVAGAQAASPGEPGGRQPVQEQAQSAGASLADCSPDLMPAHYWTWRLLAAGFTVDECQAIRGLEREVVLDHALRAVESGWSVDAGWFLSPSQQMRLEEAIGPADPPRIRPLLSRLPGLRYEEVQWFLKCRAAPQSVPAAAVEASVHRKEGSGALE